MADPISTTMTRSTTAEPWVYEIEITGPGSTKTHTFKTANTFLDGDIAVRASTTAAGTLSLGLTDKTVALPMGTPSGGVYSPTITLSGSVSAANAGWITTAAQTVVDNSVVVGTVSQSTMKLGSNAATTGTAITATPGESAQSITISAGYNAARTITIKAMSDGPKATVKSGAATSTGNPTFIYSTTNANFSITANVNVAAPSVSKAGYISSSTGTRQPNSPQTVTYAVDQIVVGAVQVGTFTQTQPVIERTPKGSADTWIDAAAGSGTTVTANKPYVRVDAPAISTTVTVRGKVSSEGYGTTTNYLTDANDLKINVSTVSADPVYIPIKEATITSPDIENITISGPTYVSANTNFKLSVSGTIPAPIVTTEGYISSNTYVGTKNTGEYSGSATLARVTVGVNATTPNIKVTPVVNSVTKGTSTKAWVDALNGTAGVATTTEPSSGPYIKVYTPAIAKTTSVTGKVTAAGYGTTSYYGTAAATTITGGTNAATAAYIPIKVLSGASLSVANTNGISGSSAVRVGTLSNNKYPIIADNLSVTGTISASTYGWLDNSISLNDSDVDGVTVGTMNKATFAASGANVTCNGAGYIASGTTVGTITAGTITAVASDPGSSYANNTAVVIPSGGWLRMSAGYYPATRISLATLVPDQANLVSGTSVYILPGYSAYDNNGNLITGGMSIYNGLVEIA